MKKEDINEKKQVESEISTNEKNEDYLKKEVNSKEKNKKRKEKKSKKEKEKEKERTIHTASIKKHDFKSYLNYKKKFLKKFKKKCFTNLEEQNNKSGKVSEGAEKNEKISREKEVIEEKISKIPKNSKNNDISEGEI